MIECVIFGITMMLSMGFTILVSEKAYPNEKLEALGITLTILSFIFLGLSLLIMG